ncbi:hypothetical protein FOS14_11480 [Skermania sp. ID1734]|uniref:LuxR C-terminal-related transcriptional regulator n=1 Tax=Skermania sp. ID1734 TaxID=2597516 RepID=UPI00117FB32C|nr:LuxR C-terminal-related transcriptional regulator [Skermania sp. ID1734]TSD99409.1 hypothetical protein FOS14_11480 [Skermania sp. ID1734]
MTVHSAAAVPGERARIPEVAAPIVSRPRLLRALLRSDSRSVFLAAAAGSGKTVALLDYAREAHRTADTAVAWLTVDPRDNERAALATDVTAALLGAGSTSLGAAIQQLRLSGQHGDPRRLMNSVGQAGESVLLCVDDVHLLREPAALEYLWELVRSAPERCRVLLAGRFEPRLSPQRPSLQRLVLEGRVAEITGRDLAFTSSEAAALLGEHGVALDDADLAAVMARTEGWAAGVCLAAMMLSRRADLHRAIAEFSGDARAVADYLLSEIFSEIPPEMLDFLVATAIPRHFDVDLAQRLSGSDSAQRILDELERNNFLLTRTNGAPARYRYHPLLRSYLIAEARRGGNFQSLQRAAAHWYMEMGDALQALEHALAASDSAITTAIVSRFGPALAVEARSTRVGELIAKFPPGLRRCPVVLLIRAASELAGAHPHAAAATLDAVHNSEPLVGDLGVLYRALRMQVGMRAGTLESTMRQIDSRSPGSSGDLLLDAFALLQFGNVELYRGHLDAAATHLDGALTKAAAARSDALALQAMTGLAAVQLGAGRLADARSHAAHAIAFGAAHDLLDDTYQHIAHLVDALVAHLRAEPVAEQVYVENLPTLVEEADVSIARGAECLEAILAFPATNERRRVASTIRDTFPDALTGTVPPHFIALLAPDVAHIFCEVGEPHWITALLEPLQATLGDVAELALLRALIAWQSHQFDRGKAELDPILSGALRPVVGITLVRALVLDSAIAHEQGRPSYAHESLSGALELAAGESIVWPFLELQYGCHDVLQSSRGRFGAVDWFADRVLHAFPENVFGGEGLTPRERELLRELPSWRTTEQIAADMFVSVNTVKTHLRGIYRKLNVRSRREAVSVALERGLL